MPLTLIRNDITKLRVNAIVNAANADLKMGGGVCGAIFSAAGPDRLQKACRRLAPVKTGEAVITKGFALPAKYVIHTVGPVYRDGKRDEAALLRACYTNSLRLANRHGCRSIAFPLLSSGSFGYPKDEALTVATNAIRDFLFTVDMNVSLVVYDKASFVLSQALYGEVKAFIADRYTEDRDRRFSRDRGRWRDATVTLEADPLSVSAAEHMVCAALNEGRRPEETSPAGRDPLGSRRVADPADKAARFKGAQQLPPVQARREGTFPLKSVQLDPYASKFKFTERLDEPFSTTLLRLIDAKGKTDVDVYKRANMDRKLFSKIRKGRGYVPSKKTAVALAVALELSLAETRALLERAGFALSPSMLFDAIVVHFISRGKFDIYEINNVLFEYDQPLLGG